MFTMRVRQALPEAPTYLTNWALEQVMLMGTGRSAYQQVDRSLSLAELNRASRPQEP